MKKSLFTIALMLLAFLTTAQAKTVYGAQHKLSTIALMGDVNGDGTITITDVTLMLAYILEKQDNNFIIANADINKDGDITIADVSDVIDIIFGDHEENGDNAETIFLQEYSIPDGFNFISGSYFPIHSKDICSGDIVHLYSYPDSHFEYSDTITLTSKGGKILLPYDFEEGTYQVNIQRGNYTQNLGTATLFKDVKMPKPARVIAHRGWHANRARENSRAAIRNAFEAGFYGCETDIQQTADGFLVVNHYPTIKGIEINTSTYDMLKDIILSDGENLPLLTDFFDIMKNEYPDSPTKLIIELKVNENTDTTRMVNTVVDAVKEAGLQDRVEYISFSFNACKQIVKLDSTATVSVLTSYNPKRVMEAHLQGMDFTYKNYLDHPEWITKAEEYGLFLNVWTVNEEKDIIQCNNLGLDFITTNNPDCAQKVYDLYKDMMPDSDISCQIIDGIAYFSGESMLFPEEYSNFVKDNNPTYVDLSGIKVSKELTYNTLRNSMNENTLYDLPVNSPIRGNNIIKGGKCKNLIITDKEPFHIVSPFMANHVSYQREMPTGDWDTSCLPFTLISNDSIQYYSLVSANDDILTFALTDSVMPGMPCLIHKNHSGNLIRIDLNDSTLIEPAKECAIGNLTYKGVMKATEILTIGDSYFYFSQDKFLACNETDIAVSPFRAYIMAGEMPYQSFTINTTDHPLNNHKHRDFNNCTMISIHDGKELQHKKLQQGFNLIRLDDGKIEKVVFKMR